MNSKLRGRGLGIAGALLTLLAGSAMAEGPAIGGYVDTQYGYNFARPVTGQTAMRVYDGQDNTISNTAHLALTGSLDEGVNYAVELDAGHDPQFDLAAPTQSSIALQEAYVNWVSPSKIGIKAGKFVTYEGIEVIESNANPTISRGYLFGFAEPFTHVGAVATYAVGKLDFAAGVVNGWDVPDDNNKGKTLVGKIGFNWGDPLTATLSGYHGPEQSRTVTVFASSAAVNNKYGANRDSVDLTVLTKLIPKVDLWLQGNLGTERQAVDKNGDGILESRGSWSGFGVQPLVHFNDKFTIGARFEYFADKDGARTGVKNNDLTNITVTPGYMLAKNVQVRAEYRYDKSNKKLWINDTGSNIKDNNSTGTVQVLVNF